MVAYSDITEQKRIEEAERQHRSELARVSRLNTMGEMAAALAHELGQPLSATLNYLHGCQLRLSMGEWEPELLGSAISQAIHHAERSGKIIQRVRQFVRRHDPESVATDINAQIDQVMGFLELELRESQGAIQLGREPNLPLVQTDPLEIQQVLINLVKNALEATLELPQERRIVEITSESKAGSVAVAVVDRGPGIAKKDLTQIFDAFYSTKRNGLGLGLAVCRSIIESHGGRLSVFRNVFGGATFRFTLPQGS
jgi:C4-dicarboxylate-specific signal transduction histidine kinase